jgi:hypothetical protein
LSPVGSTISSGTIRVPHSYRFTHGFQAKVLMVTVTVSDFDTRRQTVPIPAVRVPHGYGFTRGFQAKVLTVTVTVPNFDTHRQTVPIPAVSRYCTYTLMGL